LRLLQYVPLCRGAFLLRSGLTVTSKGEAPDEGGRLGRVAIHRGIAFGQCQPRAPPPTDGGAANQRLTPPFFKAKRRRKCLPRIQHRASDLNVGGRSCLPSAPPQGIAPSRWPTADRPPTERGGPVNQTLTETQERPNCQSANMSANSPFPKSILARLGAKKSGRS